MDSIMFVFWGEKRSALIKGQKGPWVHIYKELHLWDNIIELQTTLL